MHTSVEPFLTLLTGYPRSLRFYGHDEIQLLVSCTSEPHIKLRDAQHPTVLRTRPVPGPGEQMGLAPVPQRAWLDLR